MVIPQSFYTMRSGSCVGLVVKVTTLKGKQASALFWSPAGRMIILAGLKNFNGQLEFYNVNDLKTMATAEHFMATDVKWDPTGRQWDGKWLHYVVFPRQATIQDLEGSFLPVLQGHINLPFDSCLWVSF